MHHMVKKAWVRALRSGKYKQNKNSLCNQHGYCCLGVLAEIKGRLIPQDNSYIGAKGIMMDNGIFNSTSLGDALREELGLSNDIENELISMNDGGRYGFRRIATWIEKNL